MPASDYRTLSQLRKETYRLLYDYRQTHSFTDLRRTLRILNAFERMRRAPLSVRIKNHKATYCVLYSLSQANPMRIEQSVNHQWFDVEKISQQQRDKNNRKR